MNKFSWIGYNIDTHTGFIFASDARIEKLCSDLNDVCANLEQSAFVHVNTIASIVDQIINFNDFQLWECYPNAPYSKMAANKLFFCLHVNYPSSPHFHFKILLFFIHVGEAKRAN